MLFILATTELHKVPATILSRCQRFSFKRILPRDMEQQLLKIAAAEDIALTADGAEILARMANGALRDALSLLDQCRAVEGNIDSRTVLDTLGLAGSTQTLQLMRCLLARNAADALALFDRLYRGGKDVAALLGELSDLARDMTVMKAAPEGGNCMNFGSQVLSAGGIPPVSGGYETGWYYFSSSNVTLPWVNVGGFLDLAASHTGSGLVAAADAPYFTGEVGDIITMGVEEPRNHTTVICGILTDDAGQTVDYLLCSNTANLRNYPASAYYYANRQLTKILGLND